jgi:hypothetical protein
MHQKSGSEEPVSPRSNPLRDLFVILEPDPDPFTPLFSFAPQFEEKRLQK